MKNAKIQWLFRFLLIFGIFLCSMGNDCLTVNADEVIGEEVRTGEYNGLTYLTDDEKIVISGYVGDDSNVVIPETIEGIPVTAINKSTFGGNQVVKKVIIEAQITTLPACFSGSTIESLEYPASVKEIEAHTFAYCHNLISMKIQSGVECLGAGLFSGCMNLEYVEIPDSVTEIGSSIFGECQALQTVVLPDHLILPYGAFDGCNSLKEIKVPSETKKIDINLFNRCFSLSSVIIPDGVTEIGWGSFMDCFSLTEVYIPDSVKTIDDMAFDKCPHLTIYGKAGSYAQTYALEHDIAFSTERMPGKVVVFGEENDFEYAVYENNCTIINYTGAESEVTIPKMVNEIPVTSLYKELFLWNYTVRKVIVEANVEEIPERCFSATSIEEFVFNDTIKRLGVASFSNCLQLKTLSLPESIEEIGANCFAYCNGLEEIVLPETILRVGDEAFLNCDKLKKISFSNQIEKLGARVLACCDELEEVNLPNKLKEIGNGAFADCVILQKVLLPETLTKIGWSVFQNCSILPYVYIPKSVVEIGLDVFNGCDNIVLYGEKGSRAETYAVEYGLSYEEGNPGTIESGSFEKDGILYGYVGDKATVLGYKGNEKRVVVPEEVNGKQVTKIQKYAFFLVQGLEEILIEANVKEIPEQCINYCDNLKLIKLPSSVEIIQRTAFADNASLIDVQMSEGIKEIKDSAFTRCKGLKEITIPESVEYMGDYVFANCVSLEKVNFIGDKTFVKESMFSGCSSLKTFKVTGYSIPNSAFYDCNRITGVYIPRSVTSIESNAFTNCHFLVISAPKGSYAIEFAKQNNINYIELEYFEEEEGFQGELDLEVIPEIDANTTFDLNVLSEIADISFDSSAVEEIQENNYMKTANLKYAIVTVDDVNPNQVDSVEYAIDTGGQVIDIDFTESNGEKVVFNSEEHNGVATVTVPYQMPVSASTLTVYYVSPDGTKTEMDAEYDEQMDTITFETTHFSCFAIETDANPCDIRHKMEHSVIKKATAKVEGKAKNICKRCGKTEIVEIPKIVSVKLSKSSYIYDGKKKTPKVIVKDANGKTLKENVQYKFSYPKNRKEIGQYKVKLTYIGEYRGSKTLKFKIEPKGVALSKISGSNKGFVVKWKKGKKYITGYQVRYSLKPNFKKSKSVMIKGFKKTQRTIDKLDKNKKYYVQIRTYKTVKGKKYYSSWSKKKTVKTK